MGKSGFRTALVYAGAVGGFLLLDLILDQLIGGAPAFTLPHVFLSLGIVLISFLVVSQSLETRRRAEQLLRQAHDQLESRVQQRTAELEQSNASLMAEIAERQRAEMERMHSLEQMENARRHAERLAAELQLTNDLLHAMFDTLPVGMVTLDSNGAIAMANQLARGLMENALTGDATDETGAPLLCRLDGSPIYPADLPMNRALRHGEITTGLEVQMRRADGSLAYIYIAAGPVRDEAGRITGAVKIVQDISGLKHMEHALRTSEEKFATVFHFSPDAIVIVRAADGVLMDVNAEVVKLLEKPRSELIGKSWLELSLLSDMREYEPMGAQFQENGRIFDYELNLEIRSGVKVTVLISLISIQVGGEACVLVIAHDISKRKCSEEALLQVQAELALGIQERTMLQERQRLARELHDSVSQALYGISLGAHTALTLIDSDRARVIEALNYVISLTQAGLAEMRALIFELRPESLELEGLVKALSKQTAALRARHGIEVELSLCDEPCVPLSIKEAIYRITQEAMQNAMKHARSSQLDVRLYHESDDLVLEVCDNGIGFDPEALYPGHLGLRSMRERAANLGGTLEIVSAKSCGTQIRAIIPIPQVEPV